MKLPTRIGRYRIERLLGQGAMGAVYLGVDPSLDRRVAIKTVKNLDLDEGARARFLERFRNEARAAARLSHPSIVQVFDVGEDPEVGPFLVLELVDGPSLKQVLRERGPLSPAELVSMARDLAEALDVAHAAGIIHRDVKPDNVLVADGSRPKLADFGVARLPDAALTREGQFLGTPCYAAPETLERGIYGPKSDQFSFAAVLYELATGVRAFPGDDAIAVAHAVLHDEPSPASEVARRALPPTIDAVLARGLAKDAHARYPSARALVDALEAAFVQAGATLPADGSIRSRARLQVGERASGWRWAFPLAFLGVGAVLALMAREPGWLGLAGAVDDASPDAGELPRSYDAASGARLGPDTAGSLEDADVESSATDSLDAGRDAWVEALDAFEPPDAFRRLSPREIEDLAKDELDRAREAVAAGDRATAERHLARARELDPESSDLEEVEALIASM